MTPRQHPEHPDIIYRPDLQPRGKRALFSGITLAAWLLWFYLFVPLLSAAAWWFGIETFSTYMLNPAGRGYLITLTGYAAIIALTFLIIFGWSRYNQVRFSGPDRRHSLPPVTDEMIQKRFFVNPETLEMIQKARFIELDFDLKSQAATATTHQHSAGRRAGEAGSGKAVSE